MKLIGFCQTRCNHAQDLGRRLAASLSQIGDLAASLNCESETVFCEAQASGGCAPRRAANPFPPFEPTRTAAGHRILFSGWLDNAGELAEALGLSDARPAAVYGAALDRWGDEAESRCIGSYATIVAMADGGVRLARSPWSAPPLHYFHGADRVAAASTMRGLLACGLPSVLNRQRLADSLVLNLTGPEGWYADAWQVQLGEIVHLRFEDVRRRRWYDHLDPPAGPALESPREYVEAADALLREAVAATIAPYRRPGVFLTGGLDSTNIAARLLDSVPANQSVPAYTFLPHPDWRDDTSSIEFGSEEAGARAFSAMHPRIDLHMSDNRDRDPLSGMDAMMATIGAGLPLLRGTWVYDGLLQMAGQQGCDVMLAGWGGNSVFSSSGDWAFAEYLRRGRLVELYRILRDMPHRKRSVPHEFVRLAVMPNLPLSWQQRRHKRLGRTRTPANFAAVPVRPEAMADLGLKDRVERAGLLDPSPAYTSRDRRWRGVFAQGDGQIGDILCAWQQLHGVAVRDVALYRPLVELCRGAPTEVFRREGTDRWLAREMGRGLLPETLRTEQRTGETGGDWHMRLHTLLPAIADELERAADDPDLADILDFAELRRRLAEFPQERSRKPADFVRHDMAIPNAVIAARFVRHVTGRN